jgi:hypothetical protein
MGFGFIEAVLSFPDDFQPRLSGKFCARWNAADLSKVGMCFNIFQINLKINQ